ncbi:phage head morphogenesis protein, partial [Vibrio parahaemolyticus]|nr:phage head morphogenesis protein [Vibrio parahaemolyticus]
TFSKEHQFRSSPLVSMQALPESLATSAQEYGLTNKVLSYSYEQSKSVIQEQINQAAKSRVSTAVLDKAIKETPELNPFKEKLAGTNLDDVDGILFGFDELDGDEWLPTLQYQVALDNQHVAVMLVSAFEESSVYNVKYFTKGELAKLQAEFVKLDTK